MCTAQEFFPVAREMTMKDSSKRTLNHGFRFREFSTKSTLGVVSLLRSPVGGRRKVQGYEGLSASVVFKPAICIVGFGASGIFAR